jgi:hypothetical protein
VLSAIKDGAHNMDDIKTSISSLKDTLFSKFSDIKREYIEDLKMILSTNASEKLAPIIKEYNESLLDKTRILIGEVIPKTQESLSKNIENSIKTLHSSIQQDTTSLMKNTINKETLDDFIESLEEKFSKTIVSSQSIFNSIVSTSETRLGTRLSEIKDISKTNSLDQTQLQKNIGELLKKMENSSSKGNISENS